MNKLDTQIKTFNYWCSNSEERKNCHYCDNKGNVQIDIEVEVCGNNNKMPSKVLYCPSDENTNELKLIGQNMPKMIGHKLNDKEIKADRMKRSHNHFKKEVFDTLAIEDKKTFAKKYPDLQKKIK